MTAVAAAAVRAASVAFAMVVVIAADIGVIAEHTVDKALNRTVCIAADAAVKLDAGFLECILCTAADAATDESVHTQRGEQAGQSSVTAAIGIDYFGRENFFNFVLQLLSASQDGFEVTASSQYNDSHAAYYAFYRNSSSK